MHLHDALIVCNLLKGRSLTHLAISVHVSEILWAHLLAFVYVTDFMLCVLYRIVCVFDRMSHHGIWLDTSI